MSKKLSFGAAVALAGMTAAVTVSLTYLYAMNRFNTKVADINERQAMYTKLSEIDQKARQDYIGEIDESRLTDGICAGYVSGLGDLQAKYLSPEKYRAYLNGNTGKNVGVGILTAKDDDGNMEVIQVMPNSPAENSGMKKGDTILTMDGKEIVRITYGDALNKLDGAAGTSVRLGILRDVPAQEEGGEPSTENLDVTVTRGEYTKQSISSSLINGNVGYIRVSEFNQGSAEQFNSALTSLVQQGAVGFVIDLRNNSGGDVGSMAAILDSLLPAGNTVVYQDKKQKNTVEHTSKPNEVMLPISVLVNESSFGAAEIFAADVQGFKKGLVVGGTTAGYGTKDEVLPLSDGSAFTLSVAYYLTPGGVPFHGKGIRPDISASLTPDQEALLLRNQLPAKDDAQLTAAVSALIRQGAAVSGNASGTAPAAEETARSAESSGVESASSETPPES